MEIVKNYTKFKINSTNVLAVVVSRKESYGPLDLFTREKERVLIFGSLLETRFPSIGKMLQTVEEDLYLSLGYLSREELILAYGSMSREYLDLGISHLNINEKDKNGGYKEETLPRITYLSFRREVEGNFFDYVGRIKVNKNQDGSIKNVRVEDRHNPKICSFIDKKYANRFVKFDGKVVTFRARELYSGEIYPVLGLFD